MREVSCVVYLGSGEEGGATLVTDHDIDTGAQQAAQVTRHLPHDPHHPKAGTNVSPLVAI